MKLSIVVPFYNAEDHLERCLNSLLNQNLSRTDYEIILIDDGSNDSGHNIAKAFKNKNKNISVYTQENKGLGATRNVGMQLAKGDFIYFIDADDYLATNTLDIPLDYLQKNNLDIVGFSTLATKELNLTAFKQQPLNDVKLLSGEEFLASHKLHRLEAWWYILNRKFLLETHLKFEEGKFMEDAIFTLNIFLKAKRVMFLPVAIHRYVKSPKSIMNNQNQDHLKKIIADYQSLVFSFDALLQQVLKQQNTHTKAIVENIKFKSTASIYFMFFKLIRSKITVPQIHRILKDFEKINIYPLTNFIGDVYNQKKIRATVFIFNRKYLFYALLYPMRILHKLKLIKLF